MNRVSVKSGEFFTQVIHGSMLTLLQPVYVDVQDGLILAVCIGANQRFASLAFSGSI